MGSVFKVARVALLILLTASTLLAHGRTEPSPPEISYPSNAVSTFSVLGQGCSTIPDRFSIVAAGATEDITRAQIVLGLLLTYKVVGEDLQLTLRLLKRPWYSDQDVRVNVWWTTGCPERSGFSVFTVRVKRDDTTPPTQGNGGNSGETADPISTATGELFHLQEPDLSLSGPLPLELRRYYASYLRADTVTSALGTNWMHNFDLRVVLTDTTATVVLFRGRKVVFGKTDSGWEASARERRNYQFASITGGFQFLDPDENRIYGFSSAGALTRIEDRNGNALTVTPAASGAGPERVADGLGRTLSFSYTSSTLTRVEDQTGRAISFTHAGTNLATVTNADGKVTSFAYTSAGAHTGLLTAATMPAGNKPYTQEFDSRGRVVRQTDSRGNVTTLAYDTPSTGRTTVKESGNTTEHLHLFDNLIGYTDGLGNRGAIGYNTRSNPTSLVDRLGGRTTMTYDISGNLTSVTDPEGSVTRYRYAQQTQGSFSFSTLAGIDYPDGTSVSMTRDPRGNVTTLTDRAGKQWTFTYNDRGQTLTVRNPAGGVTSYTYNPDGTQASVTTPFGDRTGFAYDTLKRLVRTDYPDGASRAFTYDSMDRLVTETDERGNRTTRAYNDNGFLKSVTDAKGRTTTLTYDGNDLLASATDPLGRVSRRTYDATGRLATVVDGAGRTVTYEYDAVGRVLSLADPLGKLGSFTYDAEGRTVSQTDGAGRRVSFVNNRLGLVASGTDALGQRQQYSYDSMRRLTASTDGLGNVSNTTHDPDGPASITLPGGIAGSFARNELGRIVSVTDPNGKVWRREYDSEGRLTATVDPLGRRTTFEYGKRDRLSRITFPNGTASLTYDAAGNPSRALYSDGTDLEFSYDDDNRMVGADGVTLAYDAAGQLVESNGLRIAYDAAGRIASVTYAAGKTVTYDYDGRGRPVRVTDWLGGVTEIGYDASVLASSIRRPNGVTTRYSYTGDGQLSKISEEGSNVNSSIALRRNAAGRIIEAERSTPGAPALAQQTRQLEFDSAGQVASYKYDEMGRLVSGGGREYAWDLASRLTSVSSGGDKKTFDYDALGLMTADRREHVWNYALPLPSIAVFRLQGADQRYYVHLPNGVLLYSIEAADNARRFFHFDEMGNTVFLTDDQGKITDTYGITPFGEVVTRSGSTDNPFTFQGALGVMEVDRSGLYYARARFYDARTARFLSRDPVESIEPRSLNRYQYGLNNPLRFVDPDGREVTCVGVAGTFVAVMGASVAVQRCWDHCGNAATVMPASGRLGGEFGLGVQGGAGSGCLKDFLKGTANPSYDVSIGVGPISFSFGTGGVTFGLSVGPKAGLSVGAGATGVLSSDLSKPCPCPVTTFCGGCDPPKPKPPRPPRAPDQKDPSKCTEQDATNPGPRSGPMGDTRGRSSGPFPY